MDKQKLIVIAKDQLKGGIGEDQIRELLVYRGVAPEDVDTIMQDALATGEVPPSSVSAEDVLKKADEVFGDIAKEAQLKPEDAKKERIIIALSVFALIFIVAVGSFIYYRYF